MDVRRALVPALSTSRAALVQGVDGTPVARLLGPLLPGQFDRLEPRDTDGIGPALACIARPVRFPQIGWGRLELEDLPPTGTAAFARVARRARRRRRVVVDESIVEQASNHVMVLAAMGVPLSSRNVGPVASAMIGDDLAAELRAPAGHGRRGRELHSVRLRRIAHDRLWGEGLPEVAVLLATRRPDEVDDAVTRILAQRHRPAQVIIGLHGDAWPERRDLLDRLPPGSVVERFDGALPLGDVITALTRLAFTELVTKWDDDDWYGSEHLGDLLRAYNYSGADIVGKAAEFVHMEGSDLTIRRFAVGAETYSWTLAGGTLLTSRSWLERVGGWPPVRSGVDRELLDAIRRAGGRAYRTHGFQYVLRRRTSSTHTWSAADEHFLTAAAERRRGLDLEFADIG